LHITWVRLGDTADNQGEGVQSLPPF